ncbi:uncharacterized protein MYCFIDRAFT_175831 [Pseudocercospora fijiensis CIRAD86]|uniref:Uncharacterized protein n=1 Tax=Pseudocercospora fijiensis (strain CIRAD86) TaxID=383855 RepID=M3AYM8_PSEFD|nr:uncharacterized protein MYCFIDRAFT_175831 [Pseudocercospora fijiensis CIRAD86]EME82282.1 hypothetical protein MYCFIDRAFT_175831 [Pseudocercospora fijiensis CIRAD86]
MLCSIGRHCTDGLATMSKAGSSGVHDEGSYALALGGTAEGGLADLGRHEEVGRHHRADHMCTYASGKPLGKQCSGGFHASSSWRLALLEPWPPLHFRVREKQVRVAFLRKDAAPMKRSHRQKTTRSTKHRHAFLASFERRSSAYSGTSQPLRNRVIPFKRHLIAKAWCIGALSHQTSRLRRPQIRFPGLGPRTTASYSRSASYERHSSRLLVFQPPARVQRTTSRRVNLQGRNTAFAHSQWLNVAYLSFRRAKYRPDFEPVDSYGLFFSAFSSSAVDHAMSAHTFRSPGQKSAATAPENRVVR